jgi:hypothetical protein
MIGGCTFRARWDDLREAVSEQDQHSVIQLLVGPSLIESTAIPLFSIFGFFISDCLLWKADADQTKIERAQCDRRQS